MPTESCSAAIASRRVAPGAAFAHSRAERQADRQAAGWQRGDFVRACDLGLDTVPGYHGDGDGGVGRILRDPDLQGLGGLEGPPRFESQGRGGAGEPIQRHADIEGAGRRGEFAERDRHQGRALAASARRRARGCAERNRQGHRYREVRRHDSPVFGPAIHRHCAPGRDMLPSEAVGSLGERATVSNTVTVTAATTPAAAAQNQGRR